MRFRALQLILLLGALGVYAAPASAQQPQPQPRGNARATFASFQKAADQAERDADAMAKAIACFDLSEIAEKQRPEVGRARVLELKQILAQIKLLPQALIPDDPKRDAFVLYKDPQGEGELVLDRVGKEWRFTAGTVAAIPGLLKALEARKQAKKTAAATPDQKAKAAAKKAAEAEQAPQYEHVSDWIRARMSHSMRGKAFLLELWQWLGLALILLVGILIHKIMVKLMVIVVTKTLEAQELDADETLTRRSLRPFGFLMMAGFWWLVLGWLGLHKAVLGIVSTGIKSVAAIAGVWACYSLVDVVGNALERRAATTDSKFDDLLVPLVRKTLKVFVIAFGVVFVADTLKFSVSSLLAGLGLGGLAFALAAQDTVKNFFGSLTVVLDRPFEVGDWVLIDKVEGSVEEVGFRSTRIRTFYNSVITLPNSKLLTATVDNMGKRRYRRWKTKLMLTYDTPPETLEALCEGVRELIRNHPYTRKDYFQVSVVALGDSAIEVLVYVFFETPDWSRELREKQRMILDILRLARALEAEMAFPTQTVHVTRAALGGTGADRSTQQSARPVSVYPTPEEAEAQGRRTATALLEQADPDDAGRKAAQDLLKEGGTSPFSASILAEKLADSLVDAEESERKDRGSEGEGEAGDADG